MHCYQRVIYIFACIVKYKNLYLVHSVDVLMIYLLGVKCRSHLNFFESPSNTTALLIKNNDVS